MYCCKVEPSVPDLATKRKQKAFEEVMNFKIIRNVAMLTNCVNPYTINGIVILKEQNSYKVYVCGSVVFWIIGNDLKKYICGDWINILSNEVKAIRTERAHIKLQNKTQVVLNKIAAKKYVVCENFI